MVDNGNSELSQEIQALVDERNADKVRIKALEDELSRAKLRIKEIEETEIPDILLEHGVNGLTLFSGAKIEVKPFYFARVPKENPDPFYSWLEQHGHGSLIKSHFEVWTSDKNVVSIFKTTAEEIEQPFDLGRGIHWKTLEAWFKEQSEKGTALPTTTFENYIGRKAKIS